MHVYLKNGSKYRWLVVQLVEGHSPRIAGLSNCDTETVTRNLEPGIWFKLLVVDSVSVDCEKRIVCWRTTPGEESDEAPFMTHSIYGDGDQCYDFDDNIDELFNWTKYLIETNPLADADKDDRNSCIRNYEQCLFRLLHCYILSKISLQPDDYTRLSVAHKQQLHAIRQLEDAASMHSKLAEHHKEEMREIRENKLLPDLSMLLNERQCSDEFYQIFDNDLCKAIGKIQTEMVLAQSEVDQEKNNLLLDCRDDNALASARSRRDTVHERLRLHLYAREHVRLALLNSDMENAVNGPLSLACHEYCKLHQQCVQEKGVSYGICMKKLLAASVRECIELSLGELKRGVSTCGDEMTTDGQRTTDVILENHTTAEWQTLSERVASLVHNYSGPVGIQFLEFTSDVHRRCQDVLQRLKSFAGRMGEIKNLEDFDVVTEQDLGVNKELLENQRGCIEKHVVTMTGLLAEMFNSRAVMLTRKIQLCYEKCFYKEVGGDLQILYRTVYGRSMISLEHNSRCIQNLPVYKLGLEMNEEWWLALFEPTSSTAASEGEDDWSTGSDTCHGDDEQESSESDSACFNGPRRASLSSSWPGIQSRVSGMRRGLQNSTAKVLSRSKSSNVGAKLLHSTGHDLLKENSTFMTQEIDQRASNSTMQLNRSSLNIITNPIRPQRASAGAVLGSAYGKKRKSQKVIRPNDTFGKHFGDVLADMRNTFEVTSPLNKMQCLTNVLRKVSSKVEELRMRGKRDTSGDSFSVAVTAEDLLPLLVLMLLKLTPQEIGQLYVEVVFSFDLMAEFLTLGCHSYALTEFQTAFCVLDQVYEEMASPVQ